MPFAATWMDLEIRSKSDRERQISYDITYMWNLMKKMIQMNLFTRQKETHRSQKQTYGYQRGNVQGSDKLEVCD